MASPAPRSVAPSSLAESEGGGTPGSRNTASRRGERHTPSSIRGHGNGNGGTPWSGAVRPERCGGEKTGARDACARG